MTPILCNVCIWLDDSFIWNHSLIPSAASRPLYSLPVLIIKIVHWTVPTIRSSESSSVVNSLVLTHLTSSGIDFSGSFIFALPKYIPTLVRSGGTPNHFFENSLILASIASTVNYQMPHIYINQGS